MDRSFIHQETAARQGAVENVASSNPAFTIPDDLARSLIIPSQLPQASLPPFTSVISTAPNPSTQNNIAAPSQQSLSFASQPLFIAQYSLGNPPMVTFNAPPLVPKPYPHGHKNFRIAYLEKSLAEEKRAHGATNSALIQKQQALDKEIKQHQNAVSSAQDLWERFVKAKEIAEKMVEENKMERETLEKIFGDMKQMSKKKLKKLSASVVDHELDPNDNSSLDQPAKRTRLQ